MKSTWAEMDIVFKLWISRFGYPADSLPIGAHKQGPAFTQTV